MHIKKIILATFLVTAALLAYVKVELNFSGDHEGIFVLTGDAGKWFEITDDLFPEDGNRLLYAHSSALFKDVVSNTICKATNAPCVHYEWNKTTGRGYIKTLFPNGGKFLVCLSRYKIDDKLSSGLFLGGGMAPSDPDSDIFDKEEASMAYFDGKRYYHIWCNANEGIIDSKNNFIEPADWKYLGSDVLENSDTDLTIVSRHTALADNIPFRIERYLFYEAGDTFVVLVTHIKNIGKQTAEFGYTYGDEPWIGDYGKSAGDIGWLKNSLVTTEMNFDTKSNNFAGMFDHGNELAGEDHRYTNAANFIEWASTSRPDAGYFSNEFGVVARPEEQKPLSSDMNRVMSLQWGKMRLAPDQTFSFTIAVGMAKYNPTTGLPEKPDTKLH